MFEANLGMRIGQLRVKKGETQRELAIAIGVEKDTINRWESAKRGIKAQDIAKLAQHFNVSADYLLGISEIATVNTDIKMIHDYTGLSTEAINNLRFLSFKKGKDRYLLDGFTVNDYCTPISFLDRVLSDKELPSICSTFAKTIKGLENSDLLYEYFGIDKSKLTKSDPISISKKTIALGVLQLTHAKEIFSDMLGRIAHDYINHCKESNHFDDETDDDI
jgi:transcriptional regulator with XRE-family HTH domain